MRAAKLSWMNWAKNALAAALLLAPSADMCRGAEYDIAAEDTMWRVRIDEPYTGENPRDGALAARPHPGSLPKPPVQIVKPRAGEYRRQAEIAAASGESEGFQLLIMPKDIDLNQVTLSASPLKLGGGGSSIAAENIAFNQVGYVKTTKPCYAVERTGWFADPLLSPAHFSVKKGEVQPVWVTIRIPAGTPPGTYSGAVTVKAGNAEAKTLPVRLRVWAFDIPPQGSSLKLAFSWYMDSSKALHGAAEWDAKGMKRKYMDFLLAHRIGPDNIYQGAPPSAEDVKYAVEHGASAFNILNVGWPESYTDAQIESILKTVGNALEQYKKAGVADKAYVYGFDETYREKAIKQIYGAIGQKFPGLKRVVSVPSREAIWDYVDVYSLGKGAYFDQLSKGVMAKVRPRGAEFWLYLSTASDPPCPNWWIESALIQSRSLWWMMYEIDAEGFLYFAINHAITQQKPIDDDGGPYTSWNPNSFPGFNGDGHLIYGGKNGPMSSVRLANIRDGLEDYEYFKLYERLLLENNKVGNRAEARKYIKENFIRFIAVNFWIHSHEPALLRAMRERMAAAIEELAQAGVSWRVPPMVRGGEPLRLTNFRFDTRPGAIKNVKLFARTKGTGRFESFALKLVDGSCDWVEIPGRLTAAGTVEYYFELRYAGGQELTVPKGGAAAPATYVSDIAPPSAVKNPAATSVASYRVALQWGAAQDDTALSGYEVHRGVSQDFEPGKQTLLAELQSSASLPFTDNSPPAGKAAWYAVLATDVAGRKGKAEYLKVDVPSDTAPANTLAVTASPGSKSAVVRWAGTLEPDVVAFEVGRSEKAEGPFATVKTLNNIDGRDYTDQTVTAGKTYYYVVRLRDAGGNLSAPGKPAAVMPATFIKRVNCGGPAFTPSDGIPWEADDKPGGGSRYYKANQSIAKAGDLQPMYSTERWSNWKLRYSFDVAPGRYEINLHFAETNPSFHRAGGRLFNISINGTTVAEKVDVFAKAGANTAFAMNFPVVVQERQLELLLVGEPNGPALKGIEILGQNAP